VNWQLTYTTAAGSQVTISEQSLLPTVATPFTGAPDAVVDEQINRYNAASAMDEAQKLAEQGRVQEAHDRLKVTVAQVANSPSTFSPYCQQLQQDLARAIQSTSTEAVWAHEGQKHVSRMKASHAQQRCNYVADHDEEESAYVTMGKAKMRSKARAS